MGYLHIVNLYAEQEILQEREVYALEKIHGTSAHVAWRDGQLHFSPGGESAARFEALFDTVKRITLEVGFAALGASKVTLFGEAYGGKQQGMSRRYGKDLRFVVFDVQIDGVWQTVPEAEALVKGLGLEFVHYVRCGTALPLLNAERDAPSEQARRNGVEGDQPREGVVLRPLVEKLNRFGERMIVKHKRDEERETATPRKVVDPALQVVLVEAKAIADEWVTETRLDHVLDKLPQGIGIEKTRDVIDAMIEDVIREGKGEIVDSPAARQAIGRRAAHLFTGRIKGSLKNQAT